jgi:hypothetical protein
VFNFLINLIVVAIVVYLGFWVIDLVLAPVGAVIALLTKILLVLLGIAYLFGGRRISL